MLQLCMIPFSPENWHYVKLFVESSSTQLIIIFTIMSIQPFM